MKKVFLCLVALMVMVACTAYAKTVELNYEGVSFDIPDDFTETLSDDGDSAAVHMYTAPGLEDSLFFVVVAQEEEPAGLTLEDKLNALYESIADDLHEAAHEIKQVGDYTFLVITEGTGCEAIYATYANGCIIQITCLANGEAGLTQAHLDALGGIVNSLKVSPSKAE